MVQILGHLDHFYGFYGFLKLQFWPFSFIYNYRRIRSCEPYLPSRFVKLRENRRFLQYTHGILPESQENSLRDSAETNIKFQNTHLQAVIKLSPVIAIFNYY